MQVAAFPIGEVGLEQREVLLEALKPANSGAREPPICCQL